MKIKEDSFQSYVKDSFLPWLEHIKSKKSLILV